MIGRRFEDEKVVEICRYLQNALKLDVANDASKRKKDIPERHRKEVKRQKQERMQE
jgi:hypothetical protein